MNKNKTQYVKNILLPLVLFSVMTGVLTGAVIFAFKLASSAVIELSGDIYAFVRATPSLIPVLIVGAAVIGLVAAIILCIDPDCRGGGIPTAIATLQGATVIQKTFSLPIIFLSSLLTYLCGVPLGTEGPSVQMGTVVGWITSKTLGKNQPAWERYIMTGGACAGFAAATGAPLTGILFAFEEAHRRFSAMIFMMASMTVAVCMAVVELLCSWAGISSSLFGFHISVVMPLKYIALALFVGIICGFWAIIFTKTYRSVRRALIKYASKIPFIAKVVIVFVLVSVIGLICGECIGTGHHLVEELLHGHGVWYFLLIFFCVRAVLLIVANNEGITGGLFVPSLAFGAILGALCGDFFVFIGVLPQQYYIIMVVVGMASFLSASSRTPITALAFAVEALACANNMLPVTLGVTVAFAVIEVVGIHSFTDEIVDTKIEARNFGRRVCSVDVDLTVKEGAFAVGKEIRDILWPPSCVVVSVSNSPEARTHGGLHEGDVLHIHYRTAHPEYTREKLEDLVGKQSEVKPSDCVCEKIEDEQELQKSKT